MSDKPASELLKRLAAQHDTASTTLGRSDRFSRGAQPTILADRHDISYAANLL